MSIPSAVPIVVMGVSGCGKSTVAAALAERLGGTYIDADDLHSADAIAKMSGGLPLTDEDRWPWLARVGTRIADERQAGRRAVVACSALRRRYREAIRAEVDGDVVFVHLEGTPELIIGRMTVRADHFMPTGLLASQFATLESLEVAEAGIVVDVSLPVGDIVDLVRERLRERGARKVHGAPS